MADEKKTGIQGWVQTLALVVPLLLAVLAFFGIKNWSDWFGNSSSNVQIANGSDAIPPAPISTATTTPAPPPAPPAAPSLTSAIEVTPNDAVISVRSTGNSDSTLGVVLTLTVRNTSDKSVGLTWLRGTGATFDADVGTHFAGNWTFVTFTGVPDCGLSDPTRCDRGRALVLGPGEQTLATVTLGTRIANADKAMLADAKTGRFIGNLAVLPTGATDGAAKAISLPSVAIKSLVK